MAIHDQYDVVHEFHDVVHEWHDVVHEQFMKFQFLNTEIMNGFMNFILFMHETTLFMVHS